MCNGPLFDHRLGARRLSIRAAMQALHFPAHRSVQQSYNALAILVAVKAAGCYAAACWSAAVVLGVSDVSVSLAFVAAGATVFASVAWCVPRACAQQRCPMTPTVLTWTHVQA